MLRAQQAYKSSSKAASHGQTYFRKTMMLKMVCALVRRAVPQPAHGLAHGRRLRVPLVVEPLDARLVLAHRLGVRGARAPRLEPTRDHLAQTRGLVKDRVPVPDHLLKK